jgi:hypothetical protein
MIKLIRSLMLGVLALAGPCSCIAPGQAWDLNVGLHADVNSSAPTPSSEVRYVQPQAPQASPPPKTTGKILEEGRSCCTP